MRTARWATCLWPGLTTLWNRGEIAGLLWAVSFAIALNFAVLVSGVWTEVVDPETRRWAWIAAGVCWVVAVGINLGQLRRRVDDETDTLFGQALGISLQVKWVVGDFVLAGGLQKAPHDAEARLLRATMYRRCGRADEARAELDQLARWEPSARWWHEIEQEKRYLQQKPSLPSDTTKGSAGTEESAGTQKSAGNSKSRGSAAGPKPQPLHEAA